MALRELRGVEIYGDADRQVPNVATKYARVGDVALFRYGAESHVALIDKVLEPEPNDIFIVLDEYNFKSCRETGRTISLTDEHLVGIFRPTYAQVVPKA